MAALPDLLSVHPSPAVRLMLFARAVEAWSPERAAKHKRDSRGRFTKGSGVSQALAAGDEEALGGMSREQLRREARSRGIALKRGASLDEIKDALWDHHNGQKDADGDGEDKHPIDERAELRAIKLAEIEAGGGVRGKTRDPEKDRFDRADIAIERYQDALKFEGQGDPRWDAELAEAKADLDAQGITITDLGFEVKGRNGKPVVLQSAKRNGATGEVAEIRKNLRKLAADEAAPVVKPKDLGGDLRAALAKLRSADSELTTLADLRDELGERHNRRDIDAELLKMAKAGEIQLIPEENQKTITQADRDSAISVGGEDKHLVSLASKSKAAPKGRNLDAAAVDDVIRELGGSAGMGQAVVTTAQLRERFPDMSMDEFKATLKRLERDGKIDLQSYIDPKMLTKAEKESSVEIGNGQLLTIVGSKDGDVQGPKLGMHRQDWKDGYSKPTDDEEAAFDAAIKSRKAAAKAKAEAEKAARVDRFLSTTHQQLVAARTEAAARDLVSDLDDDELPDMAKRMGFTPDADMGPDALREKIVSLAGPAKAAPTAKATKAAPVAKPQPKPEPAKVMTPEATLAAAPKAIDAEKGRALPKAQTAALERYRSSDFTEINAALRGTGKRTASINKTVAEMDAAHADSKLTEPIVVHRGIGNVEKVFGGAAAKNLTGAEWTDAAPQSTTADPAIADRFQRSEGDGRRTDARLIVRVPAGVGAIQLSDGRYEAEMLLERGLRMRVVSDTGPWRRGQKKPRTIEVEVVPA